MNTGMCRRLVRSRLLATGLSLALGWTVLPATAQVPAGNGKGAPEQLPVPRKQEVVQTMPELKADATVKVLPLSLDTVLRVSQDQNGQVQVAREKLNEAYAVADLAHKNWIPDLNAGVSYYRHEGGIQDENGRFIHSSFGSVFGGVTVHGRFDIREYAYAKVDAERKVWQRRGDVSQLTSDTLLDAATTYIDLMAARAAEALSRELEGRLDTLVKQAENRASVDPGVKVEAERVRSELVGQRYLTRKTRESAASASAKLVYLLGLDPCTELVLVDGRLVPLTLVDPNLPVCDLVEKALRDGPGIREMEGLLGLIEEAKAKSQGHTKYLPTFEMTMAEGAFGAGPGSSTTWDNRFDVAFHARWNLRTLLTAKEQSRIQYHREQQAYLSYHDLRAKLTMGVTDARETSLSNVELFSMSEDQIKHAQEAYRRSHDRLTDNIKGNSPSEVLLAIRALGGAQFNYLYALRDQNKAQIRLLVLMGAASNGHHHGHE